MSKAVINIGLNVGKEESQDQLSKALFQVVRYEVVTNVKVTDGKGDWGNERTLVLELENTMGEQYFQNLLNVLCRVLKQDAISYKTSSGKSGLVFNDDYKGVRYEFNEKYFINFNVPLT